MLSTYASFFRPRGVKRFVGIGFLARMPIGTLGIATLLHVRELTGSIAFAGSVMGAQLIASAIMAPVWGRAIDAKGPHTVLRITGTVPALSLLMMFLAGPLQLSRATILMCAVVTGAFLAPVPTIVRTIWRHRFDAERERQTAFALDSVLIELAFTVGPALVAVLVALASPRAAFGMAWLFVVASVPLLYASGGLGWWRNAPPAERHLLGPLRERELLVLYASMFFLTVGFGSLEVAYLGFATERTVAAWGPALIAINSVGSALGGLLYGGLQVSMPVERLLPRLMSLLAIPIGLHMLVGGPWAMAPLAFIAGLFIAPSLTGATLLISRHAPPQYVTEAFTWSATAIVTGIGAGMAAGGALIEHWDSRAAFALAMASMFAGAVFTLALRRGHLQIQPEERR